MIAVVIPLYNKASHIAEAIKSILEQTHRPAEIVVVDDGSTDQGGSIVETFSGAGVRLVRQSNRGVSSARNRGMREVQSPYVAFLDADDYWLPEHLETIVSLIKEWPSAVLASTSHYIKRDSELYLAKTQLPPDWSGELTNFFMSYAHGLSLVNSSTACVSRQALLELGGFPEGVKRGEDVIVWVRLALRGSVVHKSLPTAVYNQEADNRSEYVRDHEIPGSLVYLVELMTTGGVNVTVQNSVGVLFDKIALMTVAGLSLNGDKEGAMRIAHLARRADRLMVFLKIRLVMLMPLAVLRLAKRFRHVPVRD